MSDWTPIDPFAPNAVAQLEAANEDSVCDVLFEVTDRLAREGVPPDQFAHILDLVEQRLRAIVRKSAENMIRSVRARLAH